MQPALVAGFFMGRAQPHTPRRRQQRCAFALHFGVVVGVQPGGYIGERVCIHSLLLGGLYRVRHFQIRPRQPHSACLPRRRRRRTRFRQSGIHGVRPHSLLRLIVNRADAVPCSPCVHRAVSVR